NEIRNAQGCDVELTFVVSSKAARERVALLPGFVWAYQYAAHTSKHPMEYGACENFRFVLTDRRLQERRA
ncbi:MAG: hypothetical protein Q8P16_02375, partial [bacterium]|nr:hypothetical protein [bacterium]